MTKWAIVGNEAIGFGPRNADFFIELTTVKTQIGAERKFQTWKKERTNSKYSHQLYWAKLIKYEVISSL